MKKTQLLQTSAESRVKLALEDSLNLYVNKLSNKYYELGLEATMQLQLATILQKELEQYTFFLDERFQVILEKNVPLNGQRDYIDIVIKYHNGNKKDKFFFIELKLKKSSQCSPNSGNVACYIDLYKLNQHRIVKNAAGCYFVLLTDDERYTEQTSRAGARSTFPMFDGALIEKNKLYTANCPDVQNTFDKVGCHNGVSFDKDIKVEYENFNIGNDQYWCFYTEL